MRDWLTALKLVALIALGGCGGGGKAIPAPVAVQPQPTSVPDPPTPQPTPVAPVAWEAGPIIDGKNYSVGVPASLTAGIDGPYSDIPLAPGHLDYITYRYGPLTGRTTFTLKYRVDADPFVKIIPKGAPELTSAITLYFQRRRDNWSADGRYQYYRWYASPATVRPIVPGTFELSYRLDQLWTSVLAGSSSTNPNDFKAAIDDADRIGFVLGGGDGLGHGVYATGNARITILSFTVS